MIRGGESVKEQFIVFKRMFDVNSKKFGYVGRKNVVRVLCDICELILVHSFHNGGQRSLICSKFNEEI
jgi:hypothetical protein